ncbi:MAG: IreB family regulatory phosphoprotein [Candidatus Carbobacillus altaicus]|uniref:UPF0297 protein BSOLF_0195 n=1 Tax=Candidatus Carbonibacillus altaicus TaxID=2163959 RepID=A0A2R6Y1D0_9BACL|nr:IreB family regulatory phosphoprotein [Candidatus Carbobacillus altaicus]PTQ56488.1 MAG: hypothetical protein BSOLF_0195 [Candidatus Carbobacillus altaicus]
MEPQDQTRKFDALKDKQAPSPQEVFSHVYRALQAKGYDPTSQLVGYLLSGEPAYIPRHDNARTIIRKIARDELIEFLLVYYLEKELSLNEVDTDRTES